MTIEQKLDLRQIAYILANNIHGDTSKAEEIYQFLARAFDEKESYIERHPKEKVTFSYPECYVETTCKEIDWSRPQLVVLRDSSTTVQTTGIHGGSIFSGVVKDISDGSCHKIGMCKDNWLKDCFIYHGEIRPKKCVNDTGVDCTPDSCICAQRSEKTTGLNFLEAVSNPSRKFDIKRASKDESYRLYYGNKFGRPDMPMFEESKFTLEDFLATDWQIVKP